MTKNTSTFQLHAKALSSVTNALANKGINVRARQTSHRSFLLRVCETRKECVKKALSAIGYGNVTFCS